MQRSSPDFWRWAAVCTLVGTLVLAGCGEDEPAPREGDPDGWSAPTAPADPGSPDGDGSRSADGLLAALRARIASGEGNSGPSYQQEVEAVAAVLWGNAEEPAETVAVQVHMEVCSIAGEVSRWLAASDAARAERAKSHPHDVALHDAQLAALAAGPEAYRAWCAGEGAALLSGLKEARYRKLFPPR